MTNHRTMYTFLPVLNMSSGKVFLLLKGDLYDSSTDKRRTSDGEATEELKRNDGVSVD